MPFNCQRQPRLTSKVSSMGLRKYIHTYIFKFLYIYIREAGGRGRLCRLSDNLSDCVSQVNRATNKSIENEFHKCLDDKQQPKRYQWNFWTLFFCYIIYFYIYGLLIKPWKKTHICMYVLKGNLYMCVRVCASATRSLCRSLPWSLLLH